MFARSSSCDITPRDRPIRLAGYAARTKPVATILDAIEISAVLLECPEARCLIFSFDLMIVGSELQDMILVRLAEHGFKPNEIVLLASHTHFAPATDQACARLGIAEKQFVGDVAEAAEGLVLRILRQQPSEIALEISQGRLNHSVNRRRYWPFPTLGRTYGVEGLVLGTGTPLGETYSALQSMALSLKERGILLCVSSKNDEAIALDAFRSHPEMVLKEQDIVVFRVNWDDKAANIKAISDTIDLGLDSFVFLDDNPAERKRVRDALPAVAVPELPEDPSEWISVLQAAGYFEQPGFSREDQLRAGFYQANARRAAQLERIGNHDDYLRSLEMTLSIAPFDAAGRKRSRNCSRNPTSST